MGDSTLVSAWTIPAEGDSWLRRLHEVAGKRGALKFHTAKGWKCEPADFSGSPQSVSIPIGEIKFTPHQIVTVRFRKS